MFDTVTLTDCDGKISPEGFPVPSAVPTELERIASRLRGAGVRTANTGEDITGSWAGLTSCYSAPEAETLYGVMAPVQSKGIVIEMATDRVAKAVDDFAESVRGIKRRWNDLIRRADLFLAEIADDEDWRKPDGLFGGEGGNVEKNEALRGEALGLIAEYNEAERNCANIINLGIEGRTRFVEGSQVGSDGPAADEFVHGISADLSDIPMEWGTAAETDHYWWEDVQHSVWDFGVGALEGTGGMLGMHSSEGWFEMSWGDALWEYHEGNIQSLGALAGRYDAESDSWGWTGWGAVGEAWKDLAHSVVPWTEWDERPGYVIGTAALNIAAMVGGAALSATGIGSVVGVPLMAWRGMAILDGMGGRGGSKVDIELPNGTADVGGLGRPVTALRLDPSRFEAAGFDPADIEEIRVRLERILNSAVEDPDDGSSGAPRTVTAHGPGGDGSEPPEPVDVQGRPSDTGRETASAVDPTAQQLDDAEWLRALLEEHPELMDPSSDRPSPLAGADRRTWAADQAGRWIDEEGLDPALKSTFADLDEQARRHDSSHDDNRVADSDGVLAQVGGRDDTLTASRDAPGPEHRIDLSGADGDRSSLPDDRTRMDGTGAEPNLRDDGPEVRNSDGGSTSLRDLHSGGADARDLGIKTDGPGSRDGVDTGHTVRDSRTVSPGSPHASGDGRSGTGLDAESQGGPQDGIEPDASRRTTDGDSDTPIDDDVPFVPVEAYRDLKAVSREERDAHRIRAEQILQGRTWATGKEFIEDFVALVNASPSIFHAFYKINGHKLPGVEKVDGRPVPTLTRASDSEPWIATDDLPDPDPPSYLGEKLNGSLTSIPERIIRKLHKITWKRFDAIRDDQKAEARLKKIKKIFDPNKKGIEHPEITKAEAEHAPKHAAMTKNSEKLGEAAARRAVLEEFNGKTKVKYEKTVEDEDGNKTTKKGTLTLPKVVFNHTGDGPLPTSTSVPASGNSQFDQIWETEDGGFVIVEAKSSESTKLGERTIRTPKGELKRVSQGTDEYFESILQQMEERGRANPDAKPNEEILAERIRVAMVEKKVYYTEARGNPEGWIYNGHSLRIFDSLGVE